MALATVGCGRGDGRTSQAASPPTTRAGAVALGAEADDLAVGLALTPALRSRVAARVTVLSPAGTLTGARATLMARGTASALTSCGAGCFSGSFSGPPAQLAVRITRPHKRPAVARFRAPANWPAPSAGSIVRRAAAAWGRLRTLQIVSQLASSRTTKSTTLWTLQAPNRLSYRELGNGPEGVIIGGTRWDRDDPQSAWSRTPQQPIRQPAPPWPASFRSAHVLDQSTYAGRPVWVVSFFDPATPSWYTIMVDKSSSRTLSMDMTANAHFMHERYRRFDAPVTIRPPRVG